MVSISLSLKEKIYKKMLEQKEKENISSTSEFIEKVLNFYFSKFDKEDEHNER